MSNILQELAKAEKLLIARMVAEAALRESISQVNAAEAALKAAQEAVRECEHNLSVSEVAYDDVIQHNENEAFEALVKERVDVLARAGLLDELKLAAPAEEASKADTKKGGRKPKKDKATTEQPVEALAETVDSSTALNTMVSTFLASDITEETPAAEVTEVEEHTSETDITAVEDAASDVEDNLDFLAQNEVVDIDDIVDEMDVVADQASVVDDVDDDIDAILSEADLAPEVESVAPAIAPQQQPVTMNTEFAVEMPDFL